MIEIQRSSVDPVLFSRSTRWETTRTSLVSAEPREEKGIPLSQRTGSLQPQKQILPPSLLSSPSVLPSASQPTSRIFVDRPARCTGYLISFIHRPFSRPPDLHPLLAAAEKMKAPRPVGYCSNSVNYASNFYDCQRECDRHRFPRTFRMFDSTGN